MRLVLTFLGVLGMGMVLTTAFAGTRGSAKPAAVGHRIKSGGRLAQKISANPPLAARLRTLVPSGMTLTSAADGFVNEIQLMTALHVARNLQIPFVDLKTEVVASDRDGLVQAVRVLRPGKDDRAAIKIAERQARADLKAAQSIRSEADRTEN